MRTRLTSLLSAVLMLSFTLALNAPLASQDEAAATEDVIVMNDLRELRGNIISETPSEIVFEYINRELNLRSRITLKRADIARIERDVAITVTEAAPKGDATTTAPRSGSRGSGKDESDKPASTYGIKRAVEVSEHTTKIYVIPMTGQMGTDVNPDVYKDKIMQDVRELDPDYIVVKMLCRDIEDRIYTRWGEDEINPFQGDFMDMYRDLVSVFRDDLRDIPQVMWVEDSVGISSVVALAWPDMYMTPSARIGGLEPTADMFLNVKEDANMYGKYREAMMGWLKGFAEYGGYDLKLMDAMVIKEKILSASWVGREVEWKLDDTGEYLVDMSDEHTANFRAKAAEDFGISDGTAETLDDLALLLGIREYVVLEGIAEKEFTDHKDNWRRALGQCETLMRDYQQFMGWAQGEDAVRYLGRAKECLEQVLSAIERYKAVEFRLAMHGVSKLGLVTTIERLKEQLRAARANTRGAGGGGTGTGRGNGPASR